MIILRPHWRKCIFFLLLNDGIVSHCISYSLVNMNQMSQTLICISFPGQFNLSSMRTVWTVYNCLL